MYLQIKIYIYVAINSLYMTENLHMKFPNVISFLSHERTTSSSLKSRNAIHLTVYEDPRCPISTGMCRQPEIHSPCKQMHSHVADLDVPEEFVSHFRFNMNCGHFTHAQCLSSVALCGHVRTLSIVLLNLQTCGVPSVMMKTTMVQM